jgi:hypothetical protein
LGSTVSKIKKKRGRPLRAGLARLLEDAYPNFYIYKEILSPAHGKSEEHNKVLEPSIIIIIIIIINYSIFIIINDYNIVQLGARGGVVVKALRYKPAGRRFDSRLCHWNFSLT